MAASIVSLACHPPFVQSASLPQSLLPIVEWAGACAKTPLSAVRTNDHEGGALATARDTNRIFSPLDPIHPGTLQGRLDDFARNQGGRRLGTIHLELPAPYSGLHRHWLFVVQKLALRHAPRHCQHRKKHEERTNLAHR